MANGKNVSTNVLVSSEQQNLDRRAKKAAQNAAARANAQNGNRSGLTRPLNKQPMVHRPYKPLFGAVKDPKAVERERAAQSFRFEQATLAIESTNVTSLTEGSIARKVAEQVIRLFPDVVVDKEKTGRGRFAEAADLAKAQLPPQESIRTAAVTMGVERARFALNIAFSKLSSK